MRGVWVLVLILGAMARVAGAQVLDPDEEAARRHFARGLAHYQAGEYQPALDEFDVVKRFRDSPALEYNIARCYDRLERYQEAVTAYERYVTQKPNAADAAEVRERITTLRKRLAPAMVAPVHAEPPPVTAVTPPPTPLPPAPVDAPRPLRRWAAPIGVGAAALVTAAVGAGLLGSVKGDYDAALGPAGCRPCSDAQIAPLENRAIAGYAMLGVAGALVVVDVALIAVLVARGKKPAALAWRGSR